MPSATSGAFGAATPHAEPARPWLLQLAGTPRLRSDGRELNPGTRKALALALLVVLQPGVRRVTAADLLWPDADPAASRRNLRRDLFRLRQMGWPIQADSGDALHAEAVALQWPSPSAVPPRWLDGLDEVAGAEWSHWVELERARLQARWLAQLAVEASQLEREGREREALQAWKGLLADGAGGPGHAEARAAVRRLQDDADVARRSAPAPDSDVSTSAPPGAAAPPPVAAPRDGSVPFVGRVAEREAIADALQRCRLVLLDGTPGVGKTRLALEALAGHGGVLLMRCRPEDTAVPYASALRGLQQLRDAAPDAALPRALRRELAALVPEWAPAAGEPELPPLTTLQRAYHQALQLLAEGNFGAFVIDDWQWADAASQALWEPNARPSGALPCLVLHRSGELAPAALQQRWRWLDAGIAVAVHVPPMSEGDARELLHRLAASAASEAPAWASSALLHAGGNPLILIETLRHLGAGAANAAKAPPSAAATAAGPMRIVAPVRELFVERVRALGPAVRRVLEAASLAEDDLRPPLLAAAAGIEAMAVVHALEHALAAELLVADERGRVRFAHELIAQSLADSQSPLRRHTVHAQLAASLATMGAEAGRVARHFDLAERPAEAAPWHLRAARVALQRRAWLAALTDCKAVLAASQNAAERCEAQLLAARAHRRLAELPQASAAIADAHAEAVRAGPDWVIEAALERCELLSATGQAETSLVELNRLASDPALTAAPHRRVLREQASALSYLGRHAQSLPLLRQLLAELPPSALGERQRTLDLLARNTYWSGDHGETRAVLQMALEHARAMGDEPAMINVTYRIGVTAREAGDISAATAHLEQAIQGARSAGLIELLRSALSTLATIKLDTMQLAEAEALLVEGERAAPGWESPDLEDVYDERRYRLHRLRGELDAAWAVMRRSLSRAEGQTHLHSVLGTLTEAADLALASADVAAARRHLDAARSRHAAAAADSLHGRLIDAHEVELLRAEGRADAALALAEGWLAADRTRRVEDHARVLIAAALAADALGRDEQAAALLAEAGTLPPLPLALQAQRWIARLVLAQPEQRHPLAVAASDWLRAGARPALEGARLAAVLAG